MKLATTGSWPGYEWTRLTNWNTVMVTENNHNICNTMIKFSHSDRGLTGIILGMGPANGRRRNGVPYWPSPHQIWSLDRCVPLPQPKITRCFRQIHIKAVQLINWNAVRVTENKHNSICNIIMKFSHSDIGSTGIILGVGPANGGTTLQRPPMAEPIPIWFPNRGVPIPRPKVTRCFWQIYNKAVQLTNWNTIKVTENDHNSMHDNNEVFAQRSRVNREHCGCGANAWKIK